MRYILAVQFCIIGILRMVQAFRFAQVVGPNIFHFLLGAKMLRHIRDVLNEDVHRLFFFVFFIC
jgi:hypothetical protein